MCVSNSRVVIFVAPFSASKTREISLGYVGEKEEP
jgi:hypothetical protein